MPPPSPWSAPRPDGPLAAALRLAQTHRAAGAVAAEVLHPSAPEALEHDIEALAREARARDAAREALALALEWPEEGALPGTRLRAARWKGWIALGGAVVLAAVAAALAVSLAPDEESQPFAAPSGNDGLRLERQLSLPPAPGRHAAS